MLSSKSPPHSTIQPGAVRYTLHLDTFVINLLEPEERAYLRIGIDLGLDRDFAAKGAKNAPPVAQVRDAILDVLAGGRAEDLLKPDGKKRLREQILSALNARAPELGAREVYFTEFLIQR